MLALVALARSAEKPPPTPPLRAATPPARAEAVRALRQGQALDLNLASASDLLLLPGVGPKLARRIVEERAQRRGFKSLDELREVKGIGPTKLAQLRPWLRLEVEQPGGRQGGAEIQRLPRPVAEHEDRPHAQPEHQLAPK